VNVFFIFKRGDDEFESSLKVLFSGDRLKIMSGEDLAVFVIFYATHMVRFVRESNPGKKLPEVCYRT
jgi:hypothetical protein